jgi:hypothetical protein
MSSQQGRRAMPPALRVLSTLIVLHLGPSLQPALPAQLATISVAHAQESTKVWVNTRSLVYHCPGTRYYGKTASGKFMLETEARAAGARPANRESCHAGALRRSPDAPQPLRLEATPTDEGARVRVWVNTSSGVYHCPGSRYYGNTRRGEYMTESEARSAGHRPAYDRPCT